MERKFYRHILILFFPICIIAQDFHIEKEKEINKMTNMGLSTYRAESFYEHGLNAKIISELEKINVRLVDDVKHGGPNSIGCATARSECVITGTVTEMTFDSSKKAIFHTTAHIGVERVLKGNLNNNEVKIKLESGPITYLKDGVLKREAIIIFHEPKFKIGEHLLLFISSKLPRYFGEKNYLNDCNNCFSLTSYLVGKIKIPEKQDAEISIIKKKYSSIVEVIKEITMVSTFIDSVRTSD